MNIKAAALAAFAITAASSALALPKNFTADFNAALADAKKSGKFVFACFSGSDWCPWCQRLDKEVFSQPEFDAATNDFVLVYIDITNNPPARQEDRELVKKYKVQGFPTVLILDEDGKKIGQTGYRRGGAKPYLEHLAAMKPQLLKKAEITRKISSLKKQIKALPDGDEKEKLSKELKELKDKRNNEEAIAKTKERIDGIKGYIKHLESKMAEDKDEERKKKAAATKERLEKLLAEETAKLAELEAKAK